VIGGEKDTKKSRGKPRPVAERRIAGFERISIDEVPSDESGEQAHKQGKRKENMRDDEVREAQGFDGGAGIVTEGREVLGNAFDDKDEKNQSIDIVDVHHKAGDQGENEPVSAGAGRARFVPVPEE